MEFFLKSEHKEILAKLEFVDDLVRCILEIARSSGSRFKSSALSCLGQSPDGSRGAGSGAVENLLFRIVLEMKILELLSTSIEMAQDERKTGRLQTSNAVKSVLRGMNSTFHECLDECKKLLTKVMNPLTSTTFCFSSSSSTSSTCTSNAPEQVNANPEANGDVINQILSTMNANKLLYTCAIDLCLIAENEELSGNLDSCLANYNNALILFHSLVQQACSSDDRDILNKYKDGVEKQLLRIYSGRPS